MCWRDTSSQLDRNPSRSLRLGSQKDPSAELPTHWSLLPKMWSILNEWFWSEKLWLPSDVTWADMEDHDGQVYPHPRDLLAALPLALALVALRFAFDRFIGLPLSRWLGVKDQLQQPAEPIPVLERHFITAGPKPKQAHMVLLAAQCGLTLHQTRRWFCRRRNQDRPQQSKKFCEASWKFTHFLCNFLSGLSILYHEPWFWRPVLCWDSYPNQPLKPALYYWFLLELSFFVSQLIRMPLDNKQKDFKELVAHHFVTIGLMVFSYIMNLLRMGSLVLLLHNSSHFLLQAAKMFNYTQYQKASNVLFIIFAFVFFYTRLVVFPTKILYSTYYESIKGRSPFFGYYFLNALMMMLQVLHIFWFSFILQVLYTFTWKGKDTRLEKCGHSLHASSSLPSGQSSSSSQRQVRGTQKPLERHWKLEGEQEPAR